MSFLFIRKYQQQQEVGSIEQEKHSVVSCIIVPLSDKMTKDILKS